jgi:hypothetical protein
MGYLTGGINLGSFKGWLYFALGDIVVNGGILGIKGSDLMEHLKRMWPGAEIVPEIAAAGLVIAFVAGVLVLMVRMQVFIEILQTADLAAILYAFYSFKPAIWKLPAGDIIFAVFVGLIVLAYLVAQVPFAKSVYKAGTITDRIGYSVIIMASIALFVAPALAIPVT